MARGAVVDFLNAFGQGLDTVNKVGKDVEIAKLINSQEARVYNPDQIEQRDTIANAKDEAGNPLYTVTTGEDGTTQVVSNVPDPEGNAPKPFQIAKQGTQYMGKTYDRALTDSDRASARNMAMSGIMAKYGDSEGAMRFQDSAVRMQREDKQMAQSDQRFEWDKQRAGREQRTADQTEADQKTMRDVDEQTGQWFKSRLANPDGTSRPATVDDHLAASQFRAMALTTAGKMDAAGKVMSEHNAQSLVKIQLETAQRDQGLAKAASALAAGDLGAVKDFYNQFIPDGAKVVSITKDPKGQIVIARESLTGEAMPPTVLKDTGQLGAALASFKDPLALYQWSQNEFRNNLALKADKRADAADGRASAAVARELSDRDAIKSASVGLYQEQNPGATPAQLAAVKAGVLSVVPKLDNNAPAEVKLAKAMVDAGMAPDMRAGLEMAISKKGQSPAEIHNEFVSAGIKNMAPAADAVAKADEAMSAMGYSKVNGRWAQAGGASQAAPAMQFNSAADAEAAAKAGKLKAGDKVTINGRTATYRP